MLLIHSRWRCIIITSCWITIRFFSLPATMVFIYMCKQVVYTRWSVTIRVFELVHSSVLHLSQRSFPYFIYAVYLVFFNPLKMFIHERQRRWERAQNTFYTFFFFFIELICMIVYVLLNYLWRFNCECFLILLAYTFLIYNTLII